MYVCCFYLFYPIYKFLKNHWLTSVLFKYWRRKFLMPVRLQLVNYSVQFSSVAQSYPTLQPCESQNTRPPCPSPTPRVYSNSCKLSWWCHPAISSSVVPFSSCPQSLPASGSFQWINSSHEVTKVLEFQLQRQSFQWTPRTDFL